MISVIEAEAIIAESAPKYPAVERPLREVYGGVLREDVSADRDQPPFHRVTMDGIAIAHRSWERGRRQFRVQGTHTPGKRPPILEAVDTCIEVMTGAVLPEGCDCVVRLEDIETKDAVATIRDGVAVRPRQNIHPQGSDHQRGDRVLRAGQRLLPPHIAVAASAGMARIQVADPPAIAIMSTGDELVEPQDPVEPFQVRRSNVYGIDALLHLQGLDRTELFHVQDDFPALVNKTEEILRKFDVLILTGGVSMGLYDFVPAALATQRVRCLFHQVRQRPGKPMWFGISPSGQPVYALPGNPVSSLVCFYRYVLPQLERSLGLVEPEANRVVLNQDVEFKPKLTYFLPVSVATSSEGRWTATPRATNTSGDFGTLAETDGFVELEESRDVFPAGHVARFYSWRQ
ncbi:MAG: molybdopterin molybdotransferase MoeA [Candidatus Hydrogenedentes bacterium]|nr:molybdopterin molybdotransferase MoeA [Candidatus Hydrogenedentota bacterium]